MKQTTLIVLGLGSNQGNRLDWIKKTISRLRSQNHSPEIEVLQVAPLYESHALLPEKAPLTWDQKFLNTALLCKTTLDPYELLNHTQKIEKELGRQKRDRWAPREIDIDVLIYGDQFLESPTLTLPHKELIHRPFSLLPLNDLLPHWIIPTPTSNQSVKELAAPWLNSHPKNVPFQTQRSLETLCELMGIINITPDSFSDGGKYLDPDSAIQQAIQLIESGATILDFGAESTRPNALTLEDLEEWFRLKPVLELIQQSPEHFKDVKISIDTRKPIVAEKAIQYGAHWINDVTGLDDPLMRKIVAQSQVDVVMTHHLGVPPTKNAILPREEDPLSYIKLWANKKIKELQSEGISLDRVIIDPGIGFGKSEDQSFRLLREIQSLHHLGQRILVGHSRKSFLSSTTTHTFSDRDVETQSVSLQLIQNGVDYIRVHGVDTHKRCFKTWSQINGILRYHSNY